MVFISLFVAMRTLIVVLAASVRDPVLLFDPGALIEGTILLLHKIGVVWTSPNFIVPIFVWIAVAFAAMTYVAGLPPSPRRTRATRDEAIPTDRFFLVSRQILS